jgi:formate dehydrogenase subunit gamma
MPRLLARHSAAERSNHWAVALLFVLAALSGLAFFHPALYGLTVLFGGGPWARILHPFFGVVMALLFVAMFVRYWRDNLVGEADRAWRANMGKLLRGGESGMPPAGKYNYGQKLVFWSMTVSLLVLLVTGIVFWRPWFAYSFPIGLVRLATLLHAIAAFVLVLTLIVHVYAAIWVKGTIRGMTRGTVTEGWAARNHTLWHREVTGGR